MTHCSILSEEEDTFCYKLICSLLVAKIPDPLLLAPQIRIRRKVTGCGTFVFFMLSD
jgi:hypothetical protein